MTSPTSSKFIRTIQVRTKHPLGGIYVDARMGCGHVLHYAFPHAQKRTPNRELREWLSDAECKACAA